MTAGEIRLIPVRGLPVIANGDDLAALIVSHSTDGLVDGDIVVVAQKIVSRAEGRVVDLRTVEPSARAIELAEAAKKDARLVEVILRETRELLRLQDSVVIVEDTHGWVCANAGVDRSNVPPGDGQVAVLLPEDADASARALAARVAELTGKRVAVIVNDSHGRAWREGSVGVALGVAGMRAIKDQRGRKDLFGYELQTSVIGVADEIAAAASLLMGQTDEGLPVVIVRGLEFDPASALGATELIRPRDRDLFR